MNSHLSVSAIVLQGERILMSKVSIKAILVLHGAEAYLVDSAEAAEHGPRVPVHCPNLENQLDKAVGGWMGGAYTYVDPVLISGVLEPGTVRKHKLVLSNIDELTISRDGEDLNIISTPAVGNLRAAD